MARSTKYVYAFGGGKAEGRGDQKLLLGGKGAGLAEMTRIGLPVPAGFTITTEASAAYYRESKRWPDALETQVRAAIARVEKQCGRRFGDAQDPLLVSVRSGAAVSMPGMMETILNLGLNDQSVEGLATVTGNRRFALDAYRRLIMMFGSTAAGIERSRFDEAFDRLKQLRTRQRLGIPGHQKVADTACSEDELAALVDEFKKIYRDATGHPFPQDPWEQLASSVNAVFGSWMAEKAVTYRRVEKITGLDGTAVNICQMVFGNLGDDSGTGVCFTRDPNSGENVLYGDLLINAQGEDVVAGIRTPLKITELADHWPELWDQLLAVRAILELHYKEMQDLEFTVERGRLYMLQCRTGKRSPAAAFRIAVEQATQPLLSPDEARNLASKGLLSKKDAALAARPVITKKEAIRRIKARDVERLFSHIIDPSVDRAEMERRRLGAGTGAVAGAATGLICFHPADAERLAQEGKDVLLVRRETSPEDVGGMYAAAGILTATGGKTSHAAVVARGWGKCCIVGCDALEVNESAKTMTLGGRTLREGESLTLDGSTGAVYEGALPLVRPEAAAEYHTLLQWCDEVRRLRVRTNADTPADAIRAVEFGAEGIGLCRTEHMFFATAERRLAMQQMIVADSAPARRAALEKLRPFQKQDFLEIFRAMAGKPVTIRLIDPPLHEFLPQDEDDIQQLAAYAGISPDEIRRRKEQLHESNPMLGHRGCRLCITYPEILEMQTAAIIEAAVEAGAEGVEVLPEIMIPLAIDAKELRILVDQVRKVADGILSRGNGHVRYLVGTMIETPRAALLADRIADVAQFVSFGTNDLTQMTMGLSRDDSARFLQVYVDQERYGIFPDDPFQSLDQEGVGLLVRWAAERARERHPKFKLGVCGEHGGDPKSIVFFHQIGMDYVSCSPFRVPVARLAAAQAVIDETPQSSRPSTGGKKKSAPKSARAAKAKSAATNRASTNRAATVRERSASRGSRSRLGRVHQPARSREHPVIGMVSKSKTAAKSKKTPPKPAKPKSIRSTKGPKKAAKPSPKSKSRPATAKPPAKGHAKLMRGSKKKAARR